jgi:hypothetical protein
LGAKRVAGLGIAMIANLRRRPGAARSLLSRVPGSWAVCVLAALVVIAGTGGTMAVARRATTDRLEAELRVAVEETELRLPRVDRHQGATTFWVPSVVSTSQTPAFILVYQDLLLNVNQDDSAPVCMFSDVSLVPIGTDVAAMTRARCAGFLGRVWSTVITAYVPLHHFAAKVVPPSQGGAG